MVPIPRSRPSGRGLGSRQAAQEKEELQRRGDELDDKIRRAEKERVNSLAVRGGRGVLFRTIMFFFGRGVLFGVVCLWWGVLFGGREGPFWTSWTKCMARRVRCLAMPDLVQQALQKDQPGVSGDLQTLRVGKSRGEASTHGILHALVT